MSNYIVNNDTVDVLSENCITILKNLPAKVYTINVSLQGQISLKNITLFLIVRRFMEI